MTADSVERVERDGLPLGRVLGLGALAIAVGAVAVVVAALFLPAREPPLEKPTRAPHQIGIAEQGSFDDSERGIELRRRQLARLESYGWVDPATQRVHIPIERALELELERKR